MTTKDNIVSNDGKTLAELIDIFISDYDGGWTSKEHTIKRILKACKEARQNKEKGLK